MIVPRSLAMRLRRMRAFVQYVAIMSSAARLWLFRMASISLSISANRLSSASMMSFDGLIGLSVCVVIMCCLQIFIMQQFSLFLQSLISVFSSCTSPATHRLRCE